MGAKKSKSLKNHALRAPWKPILADKKRDFALATQKFKVAVCLSMGVVEVVDVEENGWKVRSLVGYQVEVLRTQNRGGIL